MRAIARDVASGKYTPKLEKQEADLYMNPRRVRANCIKALSRTPSARGLSEDY